MRKRKHVRMPLVILIATALFVFVIAVGTGDIFGLSIGNGAKDLILVNESHAVPLGYSVKTVKLRNGESIGEDAYPQLQKMFDAARADGVYPKVNSGYRTASEQRRLFSENVSELRAKGMSYTEAENETEKSIAKSGHSEHQTGLAADITSDGTHCSDSIVYSWLENNAYKYGFILRYPADKIDITHTNYEPWHYRYVGCKAAYAMRAKGLCLEEYLAMI